MTKKERAFIEKLCKETNRTVRQICRKRISNGFDIDDCVSKVYTVAAEKAKTLMDHDYPDKWIYVTTYNIIKEKYRQQKRRSKEIPIDEITDILPDDSAENSKMDYNEMVEFIFNKLKPKERELFKQRFIDNLSINEICEKLDLPYTNVTTKCSRLKNKLKKILKDFL